MIDIKTFFGETGPLAKKFPGYSPREQQIELAVAIDESIESRTPLFGEAPTGVGKSFAALVPAFKWIQKSDAPVVVVTSSIILQEQYFYKDVPFLEELFGFKTNAVLLKGKSNYVCLSKTVEKKVEASSTKEAEEMMALKDWASKTKTGDVSELEFTPSYPAWSEFSIVDEGECAGKDCPLFNQCFYYNRRRQMMSAKLIICNYHYFFTALKADKMLPAGIRVVILDEGHEITSIARDMQEESYNAFSYKRINQMLATTQRKVKEEIGEIMIADEIGLMPLLSTLQSTMENVAKFFYAEKPPEKDKWTLRDMQKIRLAQIGEEHLTAVDECLESLSDYIERYGLNQNFRENWSDYYTDHQIDWQLALERFHDGVASRRKLARQFFQSSDSSLPKDVLLWIEPLGENNVTLRMKPTTAEPVTGPMFLKDFDANKPMILQDATPIVISATLSVNRRFEHIKGDLGVTRKVNEVSVSSPFELDKNLLWYLPKDIPAGNDAAHIAFVVDEMEKIIRVLHGRTLCLFTSIRSLQTASLHLRKILPKDIHVVVQGEIPKQRIIDQMKEYPNTVILATRSFFTGVDIQGQNLSAVLIDKMPFPMIGEPVNEWLMTGPNGFWKYTLPETIIAMKQGFGRLNRTVDDRGVVAVFDGRLATAQYKDHIFNSFDFKVNATRDFNTVKTYLEAILDGLD